MYLNYQMKLNEVFSLFQSLYFHVHHYMVFVDYPMNTVRMASRKISFFSLASRIPCRFGMVRDIHALMYSHPKYLRIMALFAVTVFKLTETCLNGEWLRSFSNENLRSNIQFEDLTLKLRFPCRNYIADLMRNG